MQILWLGELDSQHETRVGGKAATLARLVASFRVPPGFCITTAAFAAWQERFQTLEKAELMLEETAAIAEAYRQLAMLSDQSEPPVAVRSSAVGEDGWAASFAGQFETVLQVVGVEAVCAAVMRCWRSIHSQQAQSYHLQHGLKEAQPMGVLVQQMVQAEAAAVAFSINPVTGQHDEVVVEAVRGLGTALVGGTATPDRYRLQRHAIQEEGVRIVERSTTATPALTDEQVLAIARLAMRLEVHEAHPVDIECAFERGTLYLLQCCPVTVAGPAADTPGAIASGDMETPRAAAAQLPKVEWDRPEDAKQTWMGGELMRPLPQSLSLQYYQGWPKAFRRVQAVGQLRARNYCGREYRCWEYRDTLPPDEAERARWSFEQQVPELWTKEWLPLVQRDLADWAAMDVAKQPDDELARHLQEMLARQTYHWEIHAIMGSTPLGAVQRLIDWYLERFPQAPESEPYRLLQGQGNTSLESNHLLWSISRQLTPADLASLQSGRWAQATPAAQAALSAYSERFGGTQEARQRTMQLVIHYAEKDIEDPLVGVAQLAYEREHFTNEVCSRLRADEQAHFDELLVVALANHRLTEDHNYWLDNLSDQATKRVCSEFAKRLVWASILEQEEESEYLTVHELIQWGYGLADPLRSRVVTRRFAYEHYAHLAPDYLGQPPQPISWTDRFSGPTLPLGGAPGEIRGVGAAAGHAVGPARVAMTLGEALQLQPGEVLVCPATDPNWTPLFALAAALVTNQGGSLSHTAVVAREYRLPAVVGTHVATQRIYTGQVVEVDGTAGVVKLRGV